MTSSLQADDGPIRVFIYGSCVSRDTFEFLPSERFTLVKYVARQALVSALGRPAADPFDLSALTSRFQRRMLRWDARSAMPELLREVADEVDLVLWDIFDERLGYFRDESGGVFTRSIELERARQEGSVHLDATYVPFGTAEHLATFRQNLPEFAALLDETGLRDHTVLVAPSWATRTDSGAPAPASFDMSPTAANELTRPYVAMIAEQLEIPIFTAAADTSLASHTHPWGLAPFHYVPAVYESLAARIQASAVRFRPPRQPLELAGAPEASLQPGVSATSDGRLIATAAEVASCRYSFHLYLDGERVATAPYSPQRSTIFPITRRGLYRVRAFYVADDGTRRAATSAILDLRGEPGDRDKGRGRQFGGAI